jgi:hypothetical protein
MSKIVIDVSKKWLQKECDELALNINQLCD